MEELLQQYPGAYAYDASAPGSGNSEEEDEIEANSYDCELEETREVEEAAQEDSNQSGKYVVQRIREGGQLLEE